MTRTAFTTSRLLEFTTAEELTKLTGAKPADWPQWVAKEAVDNALDACEDANIAPEIQVEIAADSITVTDNGPGIAADTVVKLLDYTKKTSSREAYVGPSRGQQGNALQALLAIPFVLDGSCGKTVIASHGIAHHISFGIDPVRREPKIEHVQQPSSIHSGTCSSLADAKAQIVSVVRGFAWLNPHASFTLRWDGHIAKGEATEPAWQKWRPSEPAPAAWYDIEAFNRLIAACVAHDQDHGRDRTVRDFVGEFRGLARTDVRAQVLNDVGAERMSLRDFFAEGKRFSRVDKLFALMQETTKPVLAKDLGLLGREHFRSQLADAGADLDTFQYKRALINLDGVPYALEAAFGYCPDDRPDTEDERREIVGVNWSPSLVNPYRSLIGGGAYGLDALLADQRAGIDEPIVLALHLASPRIAYTDKAKSALQLPVAVANQLTELVKRVTERWAKVRKAEERDASRRERRDELMSRRKMEKINAVAFELMPAAYRKVSGLNNLWANVRQIMYACRGEILRRSGKDKFDDGYFTQMLLPNFIKDNPRLTAKWKVAFDDRGHFADPHSGLMIGLGTVAVREYVEEMRELEIKAAAVTSAHIDTKGPHGAFSAVLYIEKEGFMALLDEAELAQRFDLAIMSSKGMSVIAARELADEVCHTWRIPLFILRDFDKAGFSIRAGFMQKQSRRFAFKNQIKVYDLGLRMDDVRDLIAQGLDEPAAKSRGSSETRFTNMRKNGATVEEAEYLLDRRVELNALTSEQFIALVERKLTEHGVKKIIPTKAVLADTYRTFMRGRDVEKFFKRELRKLDSSKVTVPGDLLQQVEAYLRQHPTERWDAAVAAIVKKAAR